ncbi:hypothetical protein SERLA73DRAFT_189638 [Serpula lacrymans var. lacrymans S7.3]|uniref:DUF6534 domain-containing protein n=1 Tax=Serpula lacrymans var. lacrymans (strain S7.3) TaxID=936435 RepID=F8QEA5_SERL3|nr:hypothetical protein SERLA73DRAFT_189638 [Serpula lacrymans var. lacrymans S7.3]
MHANLYSRLAQGSTQALSTVAAYQANYLATGFWGLLVSSILLGCSYVQSYNYFHNYNDRWYLKTIVIIMFIICTMSWAFFCEDILFLSSNTCYHFSTLILKNYFRYKIMTTHPICLPCYGTWTFPTWSLTKIICIREYSAETAVAYVIQTLAQLFFAHQIYSVSSKKWSWMVASLIVLLAFTGLVCGLALTVLLATHTALDYAETRPIVILADVCMVIPTACDVTATIAMWYFLDLAGRGGNKMKYTIKSLKFLVLNRGLLLVSMQCAMLILWIVAEDAWYWLPFHMNMVNIYFNTTLVMLNERISIREKEERINAVSFQVASHNSFSLRFNPVNSYLPQNMTQLETTERSHASDQSSASSFVPGVEVSESTLEVHESHAIAGRRVSSKET